MASNENSSDDLGSLIETPPASAGGLTVPESGGDQAIDHDALIDAPAVLEAPEKTALKQSMFIAQDKVPDQHAKVLTLSGKTGIPSDLIEQDYHALERDHVRESVNYDSLIEGAPRTAKWLANPDNAAVAHDDIDSLSKVESNVKEHGLLSNMYSALNSGLANLYSSAAKVPALAYDVAALPQNIIADKLDLPSLKTQSPEWLRNNPISKYYDNAAQAFHVPEMDKSITGEIGKGNYAQAGRTMAIQFVANAPQQAAIIAATLSGFGVPALVGAGVTTAATENADAKAKGADPVAGTLNALTHGTIEAGFESIGTFGILKKWEGIIAKEYGKQVSGQIFKDFAKTLTYSVAAEGNEEFWTSVAQDFSSYITGVNPDALKGVGQRALDAGIIGAASGGVMTGPSAIGSGLVRGAQARESSLARDFITAFGNSVEAMKLRKRLPEAQRQYIESVTKDSQVENVLVPVEAMEEYFQSKNIVSAAVMQDMGTLESYNQAKATNGNVEIPLATWAEKIVGTEHHQGLLNDIKFNPDALTVNEHHREGEETKVALKAEAEQAAQAQPDVAAAAPEVDPADQVGEIIHQNLKASGKFDDKTARANAELFKSVLRTLGKNEKFDPLQFFQKLGLSVNGGLDAKPVDTGQALNQEPSFEQSAVEVKTPNATLSPLGFYSQVEREVQKMDFATSPGKDLAGRIKNIPGIKQEELDTIGLTDWLHAAEGKVTKEEVVEFIKNNGVKVAQVVLGGEDKTLGRELEDGEKPTVADLHWGAEEAIPASEVDPDGSYRSDSAYENVQEDMREYKRDPESVPRIQAVVDELKPDYTDEDGNVNDDKLMKAVGEKLQDEYFDNETDYIDSGESGMSEFKVVEELTGWELKGSDERGSWYSPDTRESYDGNLAEAQVQLAQAMLEQGVIVGDESHLSRAEDVAWRYQQFDKPSEKTIEKKVKALIKSDFGRLDEKARAEDPTDYEGKDGAELQKTIDRNVKYLAEREISETYEDLDNKKNNINIGLKHPIVSGRISGNAVKGFVLEVSKEGTKKKTFKLEGKTIDYVKVEAVNVMTEKGYVHGEPKPTGDKPIDINKPTGKAKWSRYKVPGGENYREVLLTLPDAGPEKFSYNTHFDQKNILAHVRMTDRVDAEGRKTLFVEELQSDWHQQGREKGYKGNRDVEVSPGVSLAPAAQSGVPDAPFKNTEAWAALAMKRIIRMAVEQGYEAVAWSPGSVHVDRWGTDSISWAKKPGEGFEIVGPAGKVLKTFPALTTRDKVEKILKQIQDTKGTAERFNKIVLKYQQKDRFLSVNEAAEQAIKDGKLSREDYDVIDLVNKAKYDHKIEEMAKLKVEKTAPHWLVGSVEQVGGNADGTNIEELARERGKLLERKGERVTSKEELKKVIADTLNRERNDRSLDALTESTWKQMQSTDSGVKAPRKEGMEFFYDNMLPRKVFPAILKKLDPGAKVGTTHIEGINPTNTYGYGGSEKKPDKMQVWEILLTETLKAKAVEGFSLFQPGVEGPRGRIRFGSATIDIDLLKNADLSTFLHESGHLYLEIMGELAGSETATDQIKADYQEILNWLGVKSRAEITTEHHEKWARGWESYLMEGKAPTPALRAAFAKFKVWLVAIYKQLQSLNVQLTPEVRGVMDRMVATQDEIDQAENQQKMQPLFGDPKFMGMSEAQVKRYLKATEEARQSAIDEVNAKVMRDYQRARQDWYKTERGKVRDGIAAVVSTQPIYTVIDKLRNETMPGGEPLKLSRAEVEKYAPEIVAKLPKGTYMAKSKEGGLHPDVAAELMGMESGYDLVTELSKTPDKETLIDSMTDAAMAEKYPDLLNDGGLPDEAMKAVHNEKRSEMLRMELEHLASNNMPALKDAIRRVGSPASSRRVPNQDTIRNQARSLIDNKTVKEIKPHVFRRGVAKAAKEAASLLAKGDIDGAFEAKKRELLNHELYRAATTAIEDIEKSVDKFKDMSRSDEDLAKTRDMDYVNTARAILARHGLAKSDKTAAEYTDPIRRYDPEKFATVQALMDLVPDNETPALQLPYKDFVAMRDIVVSLWDLSRSTRQVEIDGNMIDREQLIAELTDHLSTLGTPEKRAGYDKAVTKWEKTKLGLLGIRSALRRVESWVDAVDGGNPQGVFRKYIWNPISEASDRYREVKKVQIQKYLEIVKLVEKSITFEDISAPELGPRGYRFGGKAELLGALLHVGNDSNFQKLLVGRGWGTVDENGTLDRGSWDAFIARMWSEGVLTKADYDYAQAVWDLNEEMKPDAQKAHKKIYGHYFNEVTANEFQTPYGNYRGGYMPAMVDPFISSDAAIRGEKNDLEGSQNSFMFPTTGRGFTKSRVEAYAAPLVLDIRMVPGHIDKVLRFIHIEPHVKEVGRIVMDRGLRAELDALDATVGGDMLVPWLQRAAQQKIATPSQGWGGKAADTFFRELRTRTGMQVMVGNVVNTLQQVTGLSIASLKVKPRYLRNALWAYVRGPGTLADDVSEKSVFMRGRVTTNVMEIQSTIDDLLLNPSKYEQARAFASKHGYFMQAGAQNFVDLVVWTGGYDEAVENGHDEKEAVRVADAAVRATQGSFSPEDVSRFETGTPMARAFTMFYSYFNMQANLLGTEFQITMSKLGLKKGAGRMLFIYSMGFMIPAFMSEIIVKAMSGKGFDENDDDQYLDDIIGAFFSSQFRSGTALFPLIGPVVSAGVNAFNDKWYDDRISTSPAVAMIESAVSAPKSVYKALAEDGNHKKAIRDTLSALGLLSGIPLAPLGRPLGYLSDVSDGKKEPTGPIDYARGLVTGK